MADTSYGTDPTTPYGTPTASTATMGRTGTAPTGPSGVPDPNNPGYDTNGWLMGSSTNASGGITVPNAGGTGRTATVNPSTNAVSLAAVAQPQISPSGWGPLATQVFGAMPTIPNAPAFVAPSGADALAADPGYQFRLSQGIGALQNNRAAQGLFNTGGTLQDLIDYAGNSASQEYGNYFNQALAAYNTNYQTQYLNPYTASWNQYLQGVGNQGQLFNQQFQTSTA